MHKPNDSVRIVLYDEAQPGYFIVLSETDDPENMKLPGGKFEGDETPDAAANRELIEELGVTAEQAKLVCLGELPNDDGVSKRYIYSGQIAFDELQSSDEIHHIEKVTLDTIPKGKNHAHIKSAVELAR